MNPCVVVFDAKNQGPVTASVASKDGTVAEKDDCATGGIATVTANGDGTYTFAAGATKGHCAAGFVASGPKGRHIGAAFIRIWNAT